ncbi:MAG: hypothetical protein Kow0047_12220 [Anaerolineae bacterium]
MTSRRGWEQVQMVGRVFMISSGILLIVIPFLALSAVQRAMGKAMLIAVASGALRTETILDVPRYAFTAAIIIEVIGLCIGLLILGRAILHR